jgi:hypothetical protein
MSAFHPLRSVIVDFSPADESISIHPVARVEVEKVIANALKFPVFFEDEAACEGGGYLLDDEFARRIGVGILNALALSYPDLKPMITATNEPITRNPKGGLLPD